MSVAMASMNFHTGVPALRSTVTRMETWFTLLAGAQARCVLTHRTRESIYESVGKIHIPIAVMRRASGRIFGVWASQPHALANAYGAGSNQAGYRASVQRSFTRKQLHRLSLRRDSSR